VSAVIDWFDVHERPLPWRASTPWGVLVSEFMLQQTPVDRVLPVWPTWLERWPEPADLAAASTADVLRAWGRLGYPRRAARLHASAVAITERFEGEVPADEDDLRSLPGVGEYTAAAVLAFAFGRRSVVLDTNVRRVVARAVHGVAAPPGNVTAAERERAGQLWPRSHARSARWSAAVMELGALVCTARRPACDTCPIRADCAWTTLGQPAPAEPPRRQPTYEGSDRQARGRLLSVLREGSGPVAHATLSRAWPDAEQRERALAGLMTDGLIVERPRRRYALPD
jgi:A/G-specific adenine glycosylase